MSRRRRELGMTASGQTCDDHVDDRWASAGFSTARCPTPAAVTHPCANLWTTRRDHFGRLTRPDAKFSTIHSTYYFHYSCTNISMKKRATL